MADFAVKSGALAANGIPKGTIFKEGGAERFILITGHEPKEIARGKPGVHAGEKEAGDVFEDPALGCAGPDLGAVQIDEEEFEGCGIGIGLEVGLAKEEMAEVKVAMIDSIFVHEAGDLGDAVDEGEFEARRGRLRRPGARQFFQADGVDEFFRDQKGLAAGGISGALAEASDFG